MAIDPATAVIGVVGQVIERIWPNPADQAAAQLELLKLQQSGELAIITAQTKINEVEAANPNVFVSGWRPAAGWICVLGMAYTFFVQPLLGWASGYFGIPLPPNIDTSDLFILLGGMLGLGGLRSFEKFNRVAK